MRRFWRLTDLDNTNAYVLPALVEERLGIRYRSALTRPVGADGAFDVHGDARAPRDHATVMLRLRLAGADAAAMATAVDTLLAAAEGSTRAKGLRKLWRYEHADSSAQRWTWAKLAARPTLNLRSGEVLLREARLDFLVRDPLFYDPLTEAYITGKSLTAAQIAEGILGEPIMPDNWFVERTITSTPHTFTITNEGDWETRHLIFRLASQAASGFTNPKVENLTTGQEFESTTDGADANDILTVNCSPGLGRAQVSLDGGATWADDTANLTIGTTQAVIMELAPGDNSIRYTDGGTPDLKLYVWWLHAYED